MLDIKFNLGNQHQPNNEIYDVIIVGGGPAGLTAAIYTARYKLKTLMIEKALPGGQMTVTEYVENYPGFEEPILGIELASRMERQAKRFGVEHITGIVRKLDLEGDIKEIHLDAGYSYKAKSVILSMGTNPRYLNVPGEIKGRGRGVSYCATCDGPFFKNKTVAVIGGGDTAVEEAMYLTKYVKKVYLVHRRDELRATKIIQDRLFANEKIEVIWDSVVEEIEFQDKVTGVKLLNRKTGEKSNKFVDGVFIFVGYNPNSELVESVIDTNQNGYIVTDGSGRTNIEGVFACGDLVYKELYQIATAVGEGALAGHSCNKYLFEKE